MVVHIPWRDFGVTAVVECPPPASVDHGTVDLLSASGFANATFNSVAQYRCADGYVLAPDWDAATRTCGADGRWTGTPPFCRRKSISPPTPLPPLYSS